MAQRLNILIIIFMLVIFVSLAVTLFAAIRKLKFLNDTFIRYFEEHDGFVPLLPNMNEIISAKDPLSAWKKEYENLECPEIFQAQNVFVSTLQNLNSANEFQLISKLLKQSASYQDKAAKAAEVCWKSESSTLEVSAVAEISKLMLSATDEVQMMRCMEVSISKLPTLSMQQNVRRSLEAVVKNSRQTIISRQIEACKKAVDNIVGVAITANDISDGYIKLFSNIEKPEVLSAVKSYADAQLRNFQAKVVNPNATTLAFEDVKCIFRAMTHLSATSDITTSEYAEDYEWISEEWESICSHKSAKEAITLATKMLELRLRTNGKKD